MSGKDFKGMNPDTSWARKVDHALCPRDSAGNIAGNAVQNKVCHGAHYAWHATSRAVDVARGGDGAYDKARMDSHYNYKQVDTPKK